MAFKGVDVMDVKREFVLRSFEKGGTFTELCREYNISTKTGCKWKQRFLEEGFPGLEEQSRKPAGNSRSLPDLEKRQLYKYPESGTKFINLLGGFNFIHFFNDLDKNICHNIVG